MRIAIAFAAAAAALSSLANPAAADDAGKIKQCLTTEHNSGRTGRDCIGIVSDPCLQKSGNESTQSMVECVDRETKVWDDFLNTDYQRLLGSLSGAAAESVRQAERAWVAARDADCKVPYDIYEGRDDGAARRRQLRARPHGQPRPAAARLAADGEAGVGPAPRACTATAQLTSATLHAPSSDQTMRFLPAFFAP